MSMILKGNSGINFKVDTVDDLLTLEGSEGEVVIVSDENRGGTFVYRSAEAATNNGGTIFNGWCRQYDGEYLKYYGDTSYTVNGVTYDQKNVALENDTYIATQQNWNEFYDKTTFLPQTSGEIPEAPLFTDTKQNNINVLAHWYNDFGLEYTRVGEGANGSMTWYYWDWLFKSNPNGNATGYEDKRHPLLGFYRGDETNVLDWQCYWLNKAGVVGVILTATATDILNATVNTDKSWWAKNLLYNVKNFKSLTYSVWLNHGGTEEDIDASYQDARTLYGSVDNIATHNYNGKSYPILFIWDLASWRGTLDSYSGDTNTKAKLKVIASHFKTYGYSGVCILARNATNTLVGDAELIENDCLVLDAEYSAVTTYGGTDDGNYDYLATYASGNSVYGKFGVPSIATDLESHATHPSTFSRTGSTPEKFYNMCLNSFRQARKFENPNIVTVYNVAEWAEGGAALQPNMRDGFGYLNSLKQALNTVSTIKENIDTYSSLSVLSVTGATVDFKLGVNSTTLPFTATYHYTLTSTPTISEKESRLYNGRRITLRNIGNYNVILQDDSILSGTKLSLQTDTLAIVPNGSVELEYDETNDLWFEIASTSNRYIRASDGLFGPTDQLQVAAGVDTIQFTTSYSWTSTSTPFISARGNYHGRRIRIIHKGTHLINLQDNDTLSGTKLKLTGASIALGVNDNVEFEYDEEQDLWIQTSNTVNIV